MAPVTGGIADAEEDGLILPAGFLEGNGAPGIPIDRVIGVLAQVGGKGVGEVVGHRVRVLPETKNYPLLFTNSRQSRKK